jgi:DNA-binding MarR family transcriptional regulator
MKQFEIVADGQASALVEGILYASGIIEHRLNAALEQHGLSMAKLAVLQILVEAGEPIPLGVLGERLHCVKSNVTQLVDRLEAEALVQRVADPDDRRSTLAAITLDGRRRYEAGVRAREQAEREALRDLSASDRAQLLQLIGHLRGTPEPT